MRLYQYKEGFRYTSDTIFLWDFASRFIKKGDTLESIAKKYKTSTKKLKIISKKSKKVLSIGDKIEIYR